MVNLVWMILIVGGFVVAAATGAVDKVTDAALTSAQLGVETVLGILGIMVLWMGLMRIAEESGFVDAVSRLIQPVFRLIFPNIPRDDPAMGAVMMNVTANLLGLGQAATPLGLKAMQELQRLNTGDRSEASDAMCTFLALNTSSITLIPATVIAYRSSAGSVDPTEIVGTTIIATTCSTVVALTADYILRRFY